MSFLIPEREIKQTLANADATLADVRQQIIPQANAVLVLTATILGHFAIITAVLKDAVTKQK